LLRRKMRGILAAFVAMGVAGGVAVGVGQYQAATPDRTEAVSAQVPLPTARPTVVKVHVQPCERGWALKKGSCVKVVEKVVTIVPERPDVPAARSTGSSRPAATRAPASSGPSSADDEDSQDETDEVVDEDSDHEEPGEDSDEFEQEDDD
jgi:hypothetical protein